MRLFLFFLLLCCLGQFAHADYNQVCYSQHSIDLQKTILNNMDSNIQARVIDHLILLFAKSGIVIDKTNFKSPILLSDNNYERVYGFKIDNGLKTYSFTAKVNSAVDGFEVVNMTSKANSKENSVGQILVPATQITCSAEIWIHSQVLIQNDQTGKLLDSIKLGLDPHFYVFNGSSSFNL